MDDGSKETSRSGKPSQGRSIIPSEWSAYHPDRRKIKRFVDRVRDVMRQQRRMHKDK